MLKTNKIILILACILGLSLNLSAGTVERADSAYSAENFSLAADLYRQVLAGGQSSADLYYNLGNAEFRLGHLGQAVLCYERALRLDPASADARNNLDFVNARIVDRPGERGTFLGNALDAVATWMSSNAWAWIAFVLFVLTLCGIVCYIFTSAIALRKVGFFGSIATLVLTLVSLFFAVRGASISSDSSQAIVTAPSTILSTTPRTPKARTEEAMLLHEGTKVKILDSVRSATDSVAPLWLDVEVDNTHRAWLDARHAERINP